LGEKAIEAKAATGAVADGAGVERASAAHARPAGRTPESQIRKADSQRRVRRMGGLYLSPRARDIGRTAQRRDVFGPNAAPRSAPGDRPCRGARRRAIMMR